MLEIVRDLQLHKLLIEEQRGIGNYDTLHSIGREHDIEYHGALFKTTLRRPDSPGVPILDAAFYGRECPTEQFNAVRRMLIELESKGYKLMDTPMPFRGRPIDGRMVVRSHADRGNLALANDPRQLSMVYQTGLEDSAQLFPYDGSLIVSIGREGMSIVIGLYLDSVPTYTEIIEKFGVVLGIMPQRKSADLKTPPANLKTMERLLEGLDIEL